MDRIEAVEKARAILGNNYDGVQENRRLYPDGVQKSRFYGYAKWPMPNGNEAYIGDSWEAMIEDLEESFRVPA